MMLARLGKGRLVHAVYYRPDLRRGRWRSECGRARSNNVPDIPPPADIPGCGYCRSKLLDAASDLNNRISDG